MQDPDILSHISDTTRRHTIRNVKMNSQFVSCTVRQRSSDDMTFDAVLASATRAGIPLLPYVEITTGNPILLPARKVQRERVRKLIRQTVVFAKESAKQQQQQVIDPSCSAENTFPVSASHAEGGVLVNSSSPALFGVSPPKPFHLSSLLCTLRVHMHLHSGVISHVPMSHPVSSRMLQHASAAFLGPSSEHSENALNSTPSDIEEWQKMCEHMRLPPRIPNDQNQFTNCIYPMSSMLVGCNISLTIPHRRPSPVEHRERMICAGDQLYHALLKGTSSMTDIEKMDWVSELNNSEDIDWIFLTDQLGLTLVYPELPQMMMHKLQYALLPVYNPAADTDSALHFPFSVLASLNHAYLVKSTLRSNAWIYNTTDDAFSDMLAPYVSFLNDWAPFQLYAPVLRTQSHSMQYLCAPIHKPKCVYEDFVEELLWSLVSAGYYGRQDPSLVLEFARYMQWMWPHEITRVKRVFNMILRVFLVDALGGACIWEDHLLPTVTKDNPRQSHLYAYDARSSVHKWDRVPIPIRVCKDSIALRELLQDSAAVCTSEPLLLECDASAFGLLHEWFATGFVDGDYTSWERICALTFAHRYNIAQLQRTLFAQDLMRFIQKRLNHTCLSVLPFIMTEYRAMLDSYGVAFYQADTTMKPIIDVLDIVFSAMANA
jgi:hypothetical protein